METRPSSTSNAGWDVLLQVTAAEVNSIQHIVKSIGEKLNITVDVLTDSSPSNVARDSPSLADTTHTSDVPLTAREELANFPNVPWFPTTMEELIKHGGKTLQCGEDLQSDHPVLHLFIYKTLNAAHLILE